MSNVQGGGVLVKNPVSAPGPPPPFKNPGSAPALSSVCPASAGSRNCHLTVTCALACAMYVFRWEMLAALIGMGIIDLYRHQHTPSPRSHP